MPRVVSVYFPFLPTDRIRRHGEGAVPADQPLVVISRSGTKRWVSAADTAARKVGLRIGMSASKAQAVIAGLTMMDADPVADAAALERLALWALRQYSPVVAVDGTDGIVMDTEGADHLRGGEEMMITGLVNMLRGRGLTGRAAVADTWGAAHAIARLTTAETTVVPIGGVANAVVGLPIHCLRLPPDTIQRLHVLGVETVGELSAMPRAPLTLRFGPEPGRRLDQLFGRVAEPIEPLRTPDLVVVSKNFQEPIGAAETIEKYVRRLVGQLTAELEQRGLGVRRSDLVIHRVDNTRQCLRAGLAKPVRDPARLSKLLCDRIEKIDPGFGIERLDLVAVMTEVLEERQVASSLIEEDVVDITPVIDVLANRGQRLYRLSPVASDVPERSVMRIAPTAPETGADWAVKWPRPSRLFAHPERIEVTALLPDQPPAVFTWRGKRRRVKRADGPERIFGEWWQRPREMQAVRDYFVVEDEQGERYWVYRAGDGVDLETGSHLWFIHGVFG
ncbi:DNA polymerase Y family protein [Shinella sp. CPCC 101442]|uniref:Y-family DNA polymerase n=1 Tax=Shinella sp. CPCC 101442 TaxID=2932265 RepID=UPI0021536937|nr:DNA polymerase Y family protein [Shinella sp. CPCC 101442]MCR6502496.1 DNA polymerase Y family protein [Shinella sp. CPCC 101442]